MDLTPDDITENCDPKLVASASKFLLPKGIDMQAMAKDDFFIGREWLGFPTMRVHLTGFRIVLAFKMKEVDTLNKY